MLGASESEASPGDGLNDAPEIESLRIEPASPLPGRTVRAVARVTDADGDKTQASYVWQTPSGRKLGEGRSFNTTGMQEGDALEVVVTATDGKDESEESTHRIRLGEASIEIALVAIDTEAGKHPGAVLEAVVESTNDSSNSFDVLHEWVVDHSVVGRDESLDTSSLSPGDRVVLRARLEFNDRTSPPVSSRPVVLDRGSVPRIVSVPEGAIEGGVFRYQVRATSDEPGARFEFEVLKGPKGLIVDEKSGLVVWRPVPAQQGLFEIEVAARDQWGSGVAQAFTIKVDPPVAAPAAWNAPLPSDS